MKRIVTAIVLAAFVCLGATVRPAQAQVSFSIQIGTPPPAERVEPAPPARQGFVWAPGYWAWRHHHHVWMDGHWMKDRPGQRWVAPRWVHRGDRYGFAPGHWAPKPHPAPQPGPAPQPRHDAPQPGPGHEPGPGPQHDHGQHRGWDHE